MRVAQHLLAQHVHMGLHLAGCIQAAAGVVQIDLVLGVQAGVLARPQCIECGGAGVGGELLEKLVVGWHGEYPICYKNNSCLRNIHGR